MILTDKYPYYNKWFLFVRQVHYTDLDEYTDRGEMKLRKLARIAEYISQNKVCGDTMLIESLIEDVKATCILDYDGFGEYVSFEDFSTTGIYSVEDIEDLEKHKNTHFAIWYNK